MYVNRVTAEEIGVGALLTEGPLARIRSKFVILDDELVIGNTRRHTDLVQWLLQHRLCNRLPREICAAQSLVEERRLLTIFGNVLYTGDFEMTVYITSPRQSKRQAERLARRALDDIIAHQAA